MGGIIDTLYEGVSTPVSQEIGLGVRQHNDVMLSQGKSKQVQHEVSIPAGEYALIALTVPEGVNHHAEDRFLEAYDDTIDVWIIPNYQSALPASGVDLPVWNEVGPTLEATEDRLSVFTYWAPQATIPTTGISDPPVYPEYVDHATLYATSGQGNQASSADKLSAVRGRYYYPGNHLILAKNNGSGASKLTYRYNWHDFT